VTGDHVTGNHAAGNHAASDRAAGNQGNQMTSDWLADQFEANRPHLRAVAYRMLGSAAEADDAVQDAWLRVSRAGADDVANMGGWLTTIVARVSLNMLQSRASRREDPLENAPEGQAAPAGGQDPEQQAVLADSVGTALLVVLDMLAPAERLAFVLHDMFALSFDEIAPIVDRSPAATRQLASRARRPIRRGTAEPDPVRPHELVEAFLAAAHEGDFAALLALLDPDIVLTSDEAAALMGSDAELRGADAVAGMFTVRRAMAARPAWIDGTAGLVWSLRGEVKVMFRFRTSAGLITAISLIGDQEAIKDSNIE
jgi:RNA polymerase sigma factor (sigma-70 family)